MNMLQKFSGALVVIVGVVSCFTASAQETPPEAYIDPVDRQVAESGEGIAGRPYPCAVEEMEDGDAVISFLPIDECVKMLPAEEWHGLWRNDFEGSQFCARPAEMCHFDSVEDRVWLETRLMQGEVGALYEVRFIGRRTMFKGSYGHMGASAHLIVVDRPISMKMVEAPPPPMSKAEADAEWDRCERAGNCISIKELKRLHPALDFSGTTANR
ncbi:hypothetical protein [Novosphingobium sp. ERN07]|uniref:hypothetical protein n=1 Tax=Novosphingobium sp. ERN07 TaxID=2726187 RepID=UPI001456402B|nr:hypothetical protein [Novosphingobium sp. ERN07]